MSFATPTNLVPTGLSEVYHVQHGDDRSAFVEFENKAVYQEYASKQAGRSIYKDVPWITIRFAGDKLKVTSRPAKLTREQDGVITDVERFPKQWAAFQMQEEQVGEGLPVTEWPPITKSQALELKSLNIHTVEQLAAMTDSGLTWLGARQLRDLAQVWISQEGDGAKVTQVIAENQKLKNDLEILKEQMAKIMATKEERTSLAPLPATAIMAEALAMPTPEPQESALVARKRAGRPKKTETN